MSGQLRGFRQAFATWGGLGLDAHEVVTFVHTWRNIGRRFPENHWHLGRAFAGPLRDALVTASGQLGSDLLMQRYPRMFGYFNTKQTIDGSNLAALYQSDNWAIEDDEDYPIKAMTNSAKMY